MPFAPNNSTGTACDSLYVCVIDVSQNTEYNVWFAVIASAMATYSHAYFRESPEDAIERCSRMCAIII